MGRGSYVTQINSQLIESQRLRRACIRGLSVGGTPSSLSSLSMSGLEQIWLPKEAWLLLPPPSSTQGETVVFFLQCQVPDAPSGRGCRLQALPLLGWGAAASLPPAASGEAELIIGTPGRCREVAS